MIAHTEGTQSLIVLHSYIVHLPISSFCDVAQVRIYFAQSVLLPFFLFAMLVFDYHFIPKQSSTDLVVFGNNDSLFTN
jgi:hypothetical protein